MSNQQPGIVLTPANGGDDIIVPVAPDGEALGEALQRHYGGEEFVLTGMNNVSLTLVRGDGADFTFPSVEEALETEVRPGDQVAASRRQTNG